MKAILFDLDDTLFPEITFVKSGFAAVANYLSQRYGFDSDLIVRRMFDIMAENGRGRVFDILLENLSIYSEVRVRLLVYIYRSHIPTIKLYPDVIPVIHKLHSHGMRLGILTDGQGSVQRNKIQALGVESLFDVIICTDDLGKQCWKPSLVPFEVALEILGVEAKDAIYVGDNDVKDFIAPNALGMSTIQICNKAIIRNNDEKARAKVVLKQFKDLLNNIH